MALENPKVVEIRDFTTFTNDEMQTILATDIKIETTETEALTEGVLAPMDDDGCFVVEVNIYPDRITEGNLAKYPNGVCYRFISENPVIAPGINDFILFWVHADKAHGVTVTMID